MTDRPRKRLGVVFLAAVIAILAAVVVYQMSAANQTAAVSNFAPAFDLKDIDARRFVSRIIAGTTSSSGARCCSRGKGIPQFMRGRFTLVHQGFVR
ncbi:hypothetical protein [Paenibacillus baekrokdamisoli]|nr:hypothetical protein [Paenibacillus baekrokdamisoli]